MCVSFLVTLDTEHHTAKPTNYEAITNRLKQAEAVLLDEGQFAQAIERGQTWIGGCFQPGATDENGKPIFGDFISQQIFAVDVDNATNVIGADGKPAKDANGNTLKRPLYPGEAGYLSIPDALARCEQLDLKPMMVYTTFSSKPDWPKFRVVFDMGEAVTDQELAEAIIEQLLISFSEADQKCRNVNRLFFGSTEHSVKRCWLVNDDE